MRLPAISLYQPWASLLFVDQPELRKVHETRGRRAPPKYCGRRIAIHASKAFPAIPAELDDLCIRAFGRTYRSDLPRGAVIGSLILSASWQTDEARPRSDADRVAGDWSAGRYAWLTEGPFRFDAPIPLSGHQGWFQAEVPTPQRVKLSRTAGWRMPPATLSVSRPGPWGNPYRLDDDHQPWSRHPWRSRERAQGCVDHYRRMVEEGFLTVPYSIVERPDQGIGMRSIGANGIARLAPIELGGRNLACWCDLDQPCHADVLLDLANPSLAEDRQGALL